MSWHPDGEPIPCPHPAGSLYTDPDGLRACDACGAREDDPPDALGTPTGTTTINTCPDPPETEATRTGENGNTFVGIT